jgi:two-component system response regulator LytT
MKIILVEDELLIAEQLENILIKNNYQVVGVAQTIAEAEKMLHHNPDVVLLDIQLKNGNNGIEFGAVLNRQNIPFIYLTANTEIGTLKEAVNTNPVTYISKPFKSNDVIAALELIKLKLDLKPKIVFEGATKNTEVFVEDILYCEANGSYTEIVTANQTFSKRINLKDFLMQLDESFVRVHRSYIVNKTKITRKTAAAVFIDTKEIPISKLYQKEL